MAEGDLATVGVIIASIAVGITLLGILLSDKRTRKQLEITETELKHRLKAILSFQTSHGVFKLQDKLFRIDGMFANQGALPANNIMVYWSSLKTTELKIDKIVSEWDEIQKNYEQIQGSVMSNGTKKYVSPDLKFEKVGIHHVAMWVTFEYGENIKDETIWTISLDGHTHKIIDIFLKSEIEEARTRNKKQLG